MDLIKDISGLPLPSERMEELIEKYQPILDEIKKLRSLELKDVHPAVYFDPEVAYVTDKETDS